MTMWWRLRAMIGGAAIAVVAGTVAAWLVPEVSGSAKEGEAVGPAWADVRAYGAVGDGKQDDTAAFKRALASELPVLIPRPKDAFLVKETLVVPSGKTVSGVGKGQSIIKYGGTGDAFTTDPDAKNKTRDVTFRDF